jgi:transposase-like protein
MSREKQKRTQYTDEFKRNALERMKLADNIGQLARELGVARPLLYQWEAAAER